MEIVTAATAVRRHVRRLQRADLGHFQASKIDLLSLEVAVHTDEASERWSLRSQSSQNRCIPTKTGVGTAKTGVETWLSQQLLKSGVETG